MFTLQFTLCCHSNIGIFLLFFYRFSNARRKEESALRLFGNPSNNGLTLASKGLGLRNQRYKTLTARYNHVMMKSPLLSRLMHQTSLGLGFPTHLPSSSLIRIAIPLLTNIHEYFAPSYHISYVNNCVRDSSTCLYIVFDMVLPL